MEETNKEIIETTTSEVVEESPTEPVEDVTGESAAVENEASTEETGEEIETDKIAATVSGGDSVFDYESLVASVAALSEDNQLLLEELEEMQATASLSIMEKPLADYTPTEGLLLILVFIALGTTIFRIVGGIIKI